MQLLFRASGAVQIITGIIKSLGVGCCWEEGFDLHSTVGAEGKHERNLSQGLSASLGSL